MKHLPLILLLALSVAGCQRQVRMILVYEVDSAGLPAGSVVDVQKVAAAVDHRVNSGARRGRVGVLDDGRIEVGLFDDDPATVERMDRVIRAAGTLEFRVLANSRDHAAPIEQAKKSDASKIYDDERNLLAWWVPLATGKESTLDASGEIISRTTGAADHQTTEVLVANDPFNLNGGYLVRVAMGADETGRPSLSLKFNSGGGRLMRELTEKNLPDEAEGFSRRLGIILNGTIHSAPAIRAAIGERAEISGDFTEEEAQDLVDVLNAGSLPAKIKKVSQRKVSGED